MNHRLSLLNLIGVLALAVLCVLQWRHDRLLNLTLVHSEQVRSGQETELADQTKKLGGLNEDLSQLKTSLTDEHRQLLQAETKWQTANATNEFLVLERNQLRESLTNWISAVTLRDDQIKQANGRVTRLSLDLNTSIHKFNALVTNYNAVVEDLNALRVHTSTNSAGP
jgi:hypothetical protein